MKLFTKSIDSQLFAQYLKGNDLQNQKVVAKIFNPYGRGTWYIINSDPNDPDYLWAIVDLFEVEIGSVSRTELETIKVPPFRLNLERDIYFTPVNAAKLYRDLIIKAEDELTGESEGERRAGMDEFKDGGQIDIAQQNKDMLLNYAEELEHHTEEFEEAAKKAENVEPWVVAKIERSTTDLSDVTHYLDSENEIRREYGNGEGEEMAKGGVTYVGDYKTDNKNYFFRRYKDSIGSFGWEYNKKYNEGYLYALSDFDKDYYSHIKLKEGEHLFRYKTDRMVSGNAYLIKINLNKSLVYFMTDSDSDDDKNAKFDTRGVKAEYIVIEKDKYAKGGKLVGLGDAVIFDDETHFITEKNGVVGLVNMKQGAWGSNFPFTPLSKIDVSTEVTDMYGDKVKLNSSLKKGKMAKGGMMADDGILNVEDNIIFLKDLFVTQETDEYDSERGVGGKTLKIVKVDESNRVYYLKEAGDYYKYIIDFKKLQGWIEEKYVEISKSMSSGGMMAKGGEVKFADKVKSIKSSLLKRKKVSPKVQKDYGKTYSPAEAEDSAKRIVGSITAKERLMNRMKKSKK
jgi:hypothetical protein